MTEKQIDPAALATITTGIVLCDFSKVHEAMEWIMGHPIWTHEMPSMRPAITASVLDQFPDMPTGEPIDWQACAQSLRAKYGETVAVRKGEAKRATDPLSSAVAVFGATSAETGK